MAQRWDAPFDPTERKDYSRDWSAEMAKSGDALASASWALPAEASAAGLQIATSYLSNGSVAVVWFVASDPAAFAALFAGVEVAVSHTVETSAGRTLHETCILKVRGK